MLHSWRVSHVVRGPGQARLSFFNCWEAVAIRRFRTSMHGHHRCDHRCEWDTAADHQKCAHEYRAVPVHEGTTHQRLQRNDACLNSAKTVGRRKGAQGAMKSRTTPTPKGMSHSAPRSGDGGAAQGSPSASITTPQSHARPIKEADVVRCQCRAAPFDVRIHCQGMSGSQLADTCLLEFMLAH